jgi:peptide/nickel transport system substrate-binding protein
MRRTARAVVGAAALAVTVTAGHPALASPSPGEPPGNLGGACPRDVAATSAAETTATGAPRSTTMPPVATAPPPATAPAVTLPAGAPRLDSAATIEINSQPRDALRRGGVLRLAVSSLAGNWNPHHPGGDESDFATVRQPMGYFPWLIDAAGMATVNPDYVAEFEASDDLLRLTFRLNQAAVWHDGEPITVGDWRAHWNALNGLRPEYRVVSTEGYDLITSVEQGADEFEVVVTFCEPYPDYEALFSEIAPAEAVADPETFNAGWTGPINNDWFTGPFELGTYDDASETVVLVPSDKWWGAEPLLDTIRFTAISPETVAQAFADDQLDSFDIGLDRDDYALAFNTPNSQIRAAAGPSWRNVTLNSGPNGGLIQDQAVRQAIQMALDRAAIGVSDLAGIPWPAKPLNSHILVENSPFYVDNADPWGRYEPDAAVALLEEHGWMLGADGVRERDGQRLTVRFTELVGVPVSTNEAQQVRSQLADVGIEVEIVEVPVQEFSRTLTTGAFEMIAFTWIGTPFPFRGVQQLYGTGSGSNFGFSTMPHADALIDELEVTIDDTERAAIANQIDRILWEYGHTIPLYQRPELVANRTDLANYGAFGYMTPAIWTDVGWM